MNHIRGMYAQFISSDDDYIKMIALHKGKNCKRLKAYSNWLLFLNDRVRLEKTVSWRDPHTKGPLPRSFRPFIDRSPLISREVVLLLREREPREHHGQRVFLRLSLMQVFLTRPLLGGCLCASSARQEQQLHPSRKQILLLSQRVSGVVGRRLCVGEVNLLLRSACRDGELA